LEEALPLLAEKVARGPAPKKGRGRSSAAPAAATKKAVKKAAKKSTTKKTAKKTPAE
jgi:topoisomerase IA-like protein